MLRNVLVVTADASHAQFYLAHGHNELTALEQLAHPEGRLHERDLTSKERDINTCPYNDDVKKVHEEVNFSKSLITKIQEHIDHDHIDQVLVFAPPKFLGIIKKDKMPHNASIQWIAKDFMHSGARDLEILKRYISENIN